jgi:C4-dicarboxylate transporter DctM subunit
MTRFLITTGTTQHLITFFAGMNMPIPLLLFSLFVLFFLIGCCLDSTSILILTMPLLFPIVQAYGIDPIWFGVYVNMMMTLALMTPPVGINVYVMHNVSPDIPSPVIFRGILPFCIIHSFLLLLICVVPELATWLPSTM